MQTNNLHSLEIIQNGTSMFACKIKLDDFTLKGVKAYEIKSSVPGTTELTLRLVIEDLKLLID